MKKIEPYIPELGLVYPDKPDARMIKMEIINDIKVDENYPFFDKSFSFKFRRGVIYLAMLTIMRILAFIRFGLKIRGRKYLRKHRKLLKNGAMTISNHMHRWDLPFVVMALRYRTLYFPIWKEILNSRDKGLIQAAGGIPVPEEVSLIKYFNQAFDELHEKKKWIHAYPEGSRFDYYQPIRPFKKGVFYMAFRYSLPVIPMAYSYRKPHFPFTIVNFLRKKNIPMLTLRIGEPLLFDKSLSRKEAVNKLRKECHEAVVRLAGITDNPYPAEGD